MYLPDTDLLSMVYLKVEGPPLKHKITPLPTPTFCKLLSPYPPNHLIPGFPQVSGTGGFLHWREF